MSNKWRVIGGLLVAAILIFGVVGAWAIGPDEVWVDDDYTITTPGWGTTHFDSIQDGIDAVATYGTVHVAPGPYNEDVALDTPGVYLWTNTGAVIDGGLGPYGIYLGSGGPADECIVDGFGVRYGYTGILLDDVWSAMIKRNDVYWHYTGIRLENLSMWNEITKNEVHDNADRGIVLIHSDENLIKLNEVYDNRKGIVLKKSDENDIIRNEVHDNTKLGILLVHSRWNVIKLNEVYGNPFGIVLEDSKRNEIRKNDIYHNDWGIYLDSAMHNKIRGNYVYENGTGIYLDYADYTPIKKNEINSNWTGIEIYDSYDHNIAGNTIHGNDFGIYQGGSSIGNEAHWNSIVGNSTAGIRNDDSDASYIIDAILNWWGSVDGPENPGNPGGDGDSVSDNVIYSPWLGIGTDDEPGTVGWQPVSPMLIIVEDVGPVPAGGYLGTAIDAANNDLPGTDTIEVRHGTYADDVAVTDSATIISETGSASNTHLTGNMALGAAGILLGRIGNGFSIHGNIDVGAGVDASTIHINWNNLYGIMTNDGLNTLDATYNYWGAGSGRVGDIDYRPFLPETVGTIIGYMDDYGLDPLDAIEFADLVLDGFSANEAIVVMALGNTFGLTTREAAELIAEYGWIALQNALLMANGDYETFVTRLIGYGFAGTNSDILGNESGGGGASGEGGTEGTYSQGETIHLSFILTSPITGEVTIDPTANLTIVRVDQEPVTVVYWSMISYDPETGQYSLDIDTSGFAPGIYDLHIGTSSDGHNHQVRIEIT